MYTPEHPTRWVFPASLDNPSCPWLQTLKWIYDSPHAFPTSISPDAGQLLHTLVRNIQPRVVVETGCFIGTSTVWMAAALAEGGSKGVVHSFDNFEPMGRGNWRSADPIQDRLAFVSERLEEAGLRRLVRLHKGDSVKQIRQARGQIEEAGGIQLAFIDADHSIPGATRDLAAIEPLLATGGYVVLHDIFPEHCGHEGPRYILDHFSSIGKGVYEKCEIYTGPVNYGMGILRRVG